MAITEAPKVGLSDFITKVKGDGFARANRFGVLVSPPKLVGDADFTDRDLFLYCDAAQIPGLNFASTQARTYGEFREMPYEKLFDTVQLSFYVDNQMYVRRFWEQWINKIQDPYSRHLGYYKDYVSTVHIYVYDVNNNNRYAITLVDAYPKTIAAIQLESTSRDLMKIAVTIQYKYFRTSFFGEPTEAQRSASGAFLSAAGNIASTVAAAQSVPPPGYMDNFQNWQESFNGIGESISNSFGNQFTETIQAVTPERLTSLIDNYNPDDYLNLSP